jgi:hypothetical protein
MFAGCSTLIPKLPTGRSGIRIPAGKRFFSFTKRLDWPSDSPSLLFRGQREFSLGAKRPGLEADNSSSSSAEDKNDWNYTPIPPLYVMACTGRMSRDVYFGCSLTTSRCVFIIREDTFSISQRALCFHLEDHPVGDV